MGFNFKFLNIPKCTGEELMDTPDSPDGAGEQGDHEDLSILDRDDTQLDTESSHGTQGRDWCLPASSFSSFTAGTSTGEKHKHLSTTSSRTSSYSSSGTRPSMPPIYHTVNKLKQKQQNFKGQYKMKREFKHILYQAHMSILIAFE
jgi:hypothetical protein